MNKLYADYNKNFPMSDAEIDALFSTMGDGLLALYEAERAALNALSDAMK